MYAILIVHNRIHIRPITKDGRGQDERKRTGRVIPS